LAIQLPGADREVVRLRSNAEAVQRRLILLVIFSTAAALTIALALTRYISRPIAAARRVDPATGRGGFRRARITVRARRICNRSAERLDWLAGDGWPSWRRKKTAFCAICRTS